MSNTCATQSNSALVPPTGDPERILPEQELFFCTVYNHEGSEHVSDYEWEPIHTLNQAFQWINCEGPPTSPILRAQSAPTAVNPESKSNPSFCKYIRCIFG